MYYVVHLLLWRGIAVVVSCCSLGSCVHSCSLILECVFAEAEDPVDPAVAAARAAALEEAERVRAEQVCIPFFLHSLFNPTCVSLHSSNCFLCNKVLWNQYKTWHAPCFSNALHKALLISSASLTSGSTHFVTHLSPVLSDVT